MSSSVKNDCRDGHAFGSCCFVKGMWELSPDGQLAADSARVLSAGVTAKTEIAVGKRLRLAGQA